MTLPTERILTSGCGGGITFRIDHRLFPRLRLPLRVRPAELAARMKDLFGAAVHYQRSRGIHGAALADGERLLLVAEDVGRHNAVDKVKGEALLRGIPTEDRILLSTGRVSSEMLLKAARMGVPIVASRTSPTEMAVALAEQLDVTVCGYVRPDSLNVYAGRRRAAREAAAPRMTEREPAGRAKTRRGPRVPAGLPAEEQARRLRARPLRGGAGQARHDPARVDQILRELSGSTTRSPTVPSWTCRLAPGSWASCRTGGGRGGRPAAGAVPAVRPPGRRGASRPLHRGLSRVSPLV